jgi:RNA polymerase sigma factor (sigma-70 family)
MTADPENDLVRGCIKGDRACQKALYERFSARMMLVCLRYAGNKEDASDILQEGFIRVFSKISTYRSEGSLEGWIRRIMINLALRNLSRRKDIEEVMQEEDDDGTLPVPKMEVLLEMIRRLPDGYRLVFNLYILENFSHSEIAVKLGISEGTSKSQLARARALLRKMINDYNRNTYNEKVAEKNS